MNILPIIAVSVVLFAVAAVMIVMHIRSWKAFKVTDHDEEEGRYRRSQFRRRMQTSAMLGILAVALAVGDPLTTVWIKNGLFAAFYWMAVMLWACWIGLLAMVDIWATRYYYSRLNHKCMIERVKLEAELRKGSGVRDQGAEDGEQRTEVKEQRSENRDQK